jgi:RNA polymerase sigma-70 factor (ECF subfamily)
MSECGNEQEKGATARQGAKVREGDAAAHAGPSAVDPNRELADQPPVAFAMLPDALAQLVADHHASVYRYALRLTGAAADAEDLAQQAFLIAQQKGDQVRDAERVRSWLLAVVRNAFLKSRRQRIPMPASGLEIDVASVPQRAAEELAIDADALRSAIDELPEEFRVPLLMFYFEERSYREIAEQLDLPAGTVMSRLSRAKSFLRRRLFAEQSGMEAGASEQSRNSNLRGDSKRSRV